MCGVQISTTPSEGGIHHPIAGVTVATGRIGRDMTRPVFEIFLSDGVRAARAPSMHNVTPFEPEPKTKSDKDPA